MERTFEKLFNRDLSLFEVQHWHRAEANTVYKLTKNTARFNPMFVYVKNKGVSVYYDNEEVDINFELLANYFTGKPFAFRKITDKYIYDCDKLQKNLNFYDTKDIELLFIEISENIFPVVSIIMTIGNIENESLKNESIFARSLRKNTENVLYDAGEKLYEIIVKKYANHKENIDYLTIEEILEEKLPTHGEIEKRMSGYIYFEDKFYNELDIEKFGKQNNLKIIQRHKCDVSEISGAIAQVGKVKGVVKIIFEEKDIDKVQEGDILVMPMTTPNFLPAMKKASAFVTDEGGITCHASIVARELGKPCIIGTKIATQVLKDGDLIEVDANKGTVRVLK